MLSSQVGCTRVRRKVDPGAVARDERKSVSRGGRVGCESDGGVFVKRVFARALVAERLWLGVK